MKSFEIEFDSVKCSYANEIGAGLPEDLVDKNHLGVCLDQVQLTMIVNSLGVDSIVVHSNVHHGA